MGLISFIKSAGQKLGFFEEEAAAAAAPTAPDPQQTAAMLMGAINAHGIAIADLAVSCHDGTATVQGTTESQEDAEKACLIVGNHEGIGAVDNQIVVEVPTPPAVYHTVVAGDTLSKISLAQYGVIHLFDVIFEANKPMLEHPDKIYPGQVLRIPPITAPVHTVAAGETLGTIAKHWYGNAGRYTDIFEANTDQLSNPNVVEVGQQLVIPVKEGAPAL